MGIFLGNIWKEKLYKIKLNTLKYHQIQFFQPFYPLEKFIAAINTQQDCVQEKNTAQNPQKAFKRFPLHTQLRFLS